MKHTVGVSLFYLAEKFPICFTVSLFHCFVMQFLYWQIITLGCKYCMNALVTLLWWICTLDTRVQVDPCISRIQKIFGKNGSKFIKSKTQNLASKGRGMKHNTNLDHFRWHILWPVYNSNRKNDGKIWSKISRLISEYIR